jgi:3-oxoacyl-[acyl-carrier protein] reductase
VDLGLHGRTAIVCAASSGLGKACAHALAAEGVRVVINARSSKQLMRAAQEIENDTGITVGVVAGDIVTETVRAMLLNACPSPDILINNAGGPPPGDFRHWTRDDWIKALDTTMLTSIALTQAVLDGMVARGFGRIVNITSSGVKSPGGYPSLGLSIGARAGLTGFVGTLARQVASSNVTINSLLPGRFDTDRLKSLVREQAEKENRTAEQITAEQLQQIPARRFGTAEECGRVCAFICSAHASYITGQNIVTDGGAFTGLL